MRICCQGHHRFLGRDQESLLKEVATSASRSSQPHPLPDLTHRLGGEGEEALCAIAEDVVDLMGQREEFLVALAGGGVVGGEAFGECALQVGATSGGVAFGLPELLVVRVDELVQLADVAGLRVSRV